MKRVTIHAAKTQLSRLIEEACGGEEIVIARGDEPVVKLVPIRARKARRRFGAMRGRARTTAAFFGPLSNDELDRWGH